MYSEEKNHGLFLENGLPQNMSRTNLESTRNHAVLKETRADFLAGKWPAGCNRCRELESHGLPSLRTHRVTRAEENGSAPSLVHDIAQKTAADGKIDPQDFPLRELDIRFGNRCNLRCRSCGPQSSSSWYRDFFRLGNTKYTLGGEADLDFFEDDNGIVRAMSDTNNWADGLDVLDLFPADVSSINRIYFAGGEPLLDPAHARFLRALIERGVAASIYLEYNTNLSLLTDETLALWEHFKSIGVGVSIDGVGGHHEYIRFPSKFSRVEKNLERLDASLPNLRGWLSITVSILNICHLPDAILWKAGKSYQRIVNNLSRPPISTRLLKSPRHLNLQYMPAPAKAYAAMRLREGLARIKASGLLPEAKLNSVAATFEGLIAFMNGADHAHEWPQLWREHRELDNLRAQDFSRLEPQLFSYLNAHDKSPQPLALELR